MNDNVVTALAVVGTALFCLGLVLQVVWSEGNAMWVRRAKCRRERKSTGRHLAAGHVLCDCGCDGWRKPPNGPQRPLPRWPRRLAAWVWAQAFSRVCGWS